MVQKNDDSNVRSSLQTKSEGRTKYQPTKREIPKGGAVQNRTPLRKTPNVSNRVPSPIHAPKETQLEEEIKKQELEEEIVSQESINHSFNNSRDI